MKAQKLTLAGVGLALLAVAPAFAADNRDQAVLLYLDGGGITEARHFDPLQDAKLKTGYDLGGGVGVQLNKYVTVRGSFGFSRATGMDPDADYIDFNGTPYNRYIYSGELQFGYPTQHGLTPYVLVGGGGMSWSNRGPVSYPSYTQGFGKAGLGLSYDIPNSRLGIFVQGTGLDYSWGRFGPSRNQFDLTYTAGLRLRLPL